MAKKMTLEQVARMTQKGFDGMANKMDSFREEVNGRFEEVNLRFDGVDRRLDAVEGEIKDIKTILGPLVRTYCLYGI